MPARRASNSRCSRPGPTDRSRPRLMGGRENAVTYPMIGDPQLAVSRIKIMARLDIAERRLPQDGRIKLTVRGHEIDFRVSSIPSLHGEKGVLRILDRPAVEFDYAKLGLPADIREGIERALDLPNGMVLVTGPTGSGKTTTLYTG